MTGPAPTVLVTGANSGIGLAAVTELLERGARVVATVRSDAAAETVAALDGRGTLQIERLDVTDATRCAEVIEAHRPDVLVNNAGAALLGAVVDIDDAQATDQFEALVLGPVRLARLAVPHMADRGHGRIVNVSSMLAQANVPFTGWYGAAKAALDSLGNTLRLELAATGVSVISIECGAIATDVWDDAGAAVAGGDDEVTEAARHRWVELTDAVSAFYPDPEGVGRVIADAATTRRPRRVYRVGFGSRLGVLSNLVPKAVEDRVAAVLFRLGG